MNDRIEKTIRIDAPVARVWHALTDYREFGAWFRVDLSEPFEPGREAVGRITHPGYEHVVWRAVVQRIEPERLFSMKWHPYAVEPGVDYAAEPQTLIEFRLVPDGDGTVLTITESGFDRLPAHRRDEAFHMNDQGWSQQVLNIQRHVEAGPGEPDRAG